MILRPKEKILISIAAFAGSFVLLTILIIYPLLKEINKNSGEFVFLKKQLIQSQNEIEGLKTSAALYKAHQGDIEKIDKLFVNADMPIEFMNFLEESALKSQLDLEVSSMASPSKKESGSWPSIYFQVLMAGSFSQCLKFLEKMENSPYLINILDLNIKKLTTTETQSNSGPSFLRNKNLSPESVSATILMEVFTR